MCLVSQKCKGRHEIMRLRNRCINRTHKKNCVLVVDCLTHDGIIISLCAPVSAGRPLDSLEHNLVVTRLYPEILHIAY